MFFLERKNGLRRGQNAELSRKEGIQHKLNEQHQGGSSRKTFQMITNHKVTKVKQNNNILKKSIFCYSEKTLKNQKNIKKWVFFQKLCTIRLKNLGFIILGYKMLKIYILKNISFVKRAHISRKIRLRVVRPEKKEFCPFVGFLTFEHPAPLLVFEPNSAWEQKLEG